MWRTLTKCSRRLWWTLGRGHQSSYSASSPELAGDPISIPGSSSPELEATARREARSSTRAGCMVSGCDHAAMMESPVHTATVGGCCHCAPHHHLPTMTVSFLWMTKTDQNIPILTTLYNIEQCRARQVKINIKGP